MNERSRSEAAGPPLREKIIGLGERSIRKSYYPQLRQQLEELETARKKLAESEARYRSLVENINEVIISLDTEGRVTYASPVLQNSYGLAPEQIVGQKLTQLIHSDDRAALGGSLESALAGRQKFLEFRLLGKEGVTRYMRISSRPLLEQGRVVGLTCILSDITEGKLAEDALHKLNEELERRVAERTADLERSNKDLEAFSYSISHDLRAPLRAIDGFSGILMEEYHSRFDEEGRHNLEVIRRSSARMARLIDDVLEFSRVSRRELAAAPVDMAALVREVFEEARSAAPQRKIVLRLGAAPPVRGDCSMIRQVLANLFSNAVKFTARCAEAVIEVDGTVEGDEVVYRVKDNGAGFDMRYADKLFGVFQRLHGADEFEGTGIGLAIVKHIVLRHGGRVWAEGKVDEGASFSFTLPAALAAETPQNAP
ncbi:ATP-binding protein [Bradyrhizobium sp. WD16]|uniref:sensor histidine kinase n=1 Tax=Bradyrhizobium sp. WD16 TaxID=1521768 RepID=UPI0020A5FE5D|nr:ATP-binding protein [Bradyrhizobium sp. WD16]UTD25894.1 histidine kinase [Bradyrhizobium sp. WD16]